LFRDRTGLVGGPLCGFLRHFAAFYTVIQPVIHPCLGLSLKEWKDAGRERTDGSLWKREPRFSPARIASWNDERDVIRPSGGRRFLITILFSFPFLRGFYLEKS